MRPNELNVNWIDNRICLSVPAHGVEESRMIWKQFRGCVIPSILAADYSAEVFNRLIHEIHAVVPVVSVALGNAGDATQWDKALGAVDGSQIHLNQPATQTGYATGYVAGKGWDVWVNGVVEPTGTPGIVRIPWIHTKPEHATLPVNAVAAWFAGGVKYVLPHVFSAVEDKATHEVIPAKIAQFVELCRC